jgi:general secretion pathway protein A
MLDVSTDRLGSLTYEPGFGLREKPFSLSPDPRFFFRNSGNAAAFDALLGGIRRREGILLLTGEVGTGKTTLCRAVLQSLGPTAVSAFVSDPFVSIDAFLKTLLHEFGTVSADDLYQSHFQHMDRADLSRILRKSLRPLQPQQPPAVVIIDEAHKLSAQLLDEIRILSDPEEQQGLLQVVLVGQPDLNARVDIFDLRQLAQRIAARCQLSRMDHKDVWPYVSHRLLVAGNNVTLRFSDNAIDVVFAASGGVPRLINLVCDGALKRAAEAGTMTVDVEQVVGAVDAAGLPVSSTFRPRTANPSQPRVAVEERPVRQAASARPERQPPHPLASGLPKVHPRREFPPRVQADPSDDFEEASPTASSSRPRWRAWVGAVLLISVSGIGYRYWAPAGAPLLSQLKPSRTSSPPAISRPTEPARFVVEMGTFESAEQAAQALQEFRGAGFHAYSIEVKDTRGEAAVSVFLGPYADRARAERDFTTARVQVPGHESARVVAIGPTELPAGRDSN